MRIDPRYDALCEPLAGDHVTSVKYLGVVRDASIFGCLIDRIKLLFIVFLTAYLISKRLLILKL